MQCVNVNIVRRQRSGMDTLTQGTWETDKNTIKHHKQENQEVIPFPAGDRKAAINRQESMTNTKHK